MLAYSLFTIASLHVLLMAVLERRLHGGTLPPALQKLPPLLTMETLLFRIIWAGFVLLTLTLASGIVFSEELFGKAAALQSQDGLRHPVVAHLRRTARRPASSTAGAAASRCAGRSPVFSCWCLPISAANSCLKSFWVGRSRQSAVQQTAPISPCKAFRLVPQLTPRGFRLPDNPDGAADTEFSFHNPAGLIRGRHSLIDADSNIICFTDRFRILLGFRNQHDGAQPLPVEAPHPDWAPRRARLPPSCSPRPTNSWASCCSATTSSTLLPRCWSAKSPGAISATAQYALLAATGAAAFMILVFSEITPKVVGAGLSRAHRAAVELRADAVAQAAQPHRVVRQPVRARRCCGCCGSSPRTAVTNTSFPLEELRTLVLEAGNYIPNKSIRASCSICSISKPLRWTM